MNRWLFNAVLFVFLAGAVYAQKDKRVGIQTNLLSHVRAFPAMNLGLMFQEDRLQYTIEADFVYGVNHLNERSEESVLMNDFTTRHRNFLSLDLTGGAHWFLTDKKVSFIGLRGNLGYFSFNHQQRLCVDAQNIGGVCVCNQVEDYQFNTSHIRLGGHLRFGGVIPFNERNELEISMDVGVFAFIRNNTEAQGSHDICGSVGRADVLPLFPGLERWLGNAMLDFDRLSEPYVRLNMIYRFIL